MRDGDAYEMPTMPEGPVTRSFVVLVVEAAMLALAGDRWEDVQDEFRQELENRIAVGCFTEEEEYGENEGEEEGSIPSSQGEDQKTCL